MTTVKATDVTLREALRDNAYRNARGYLTRERHPRVYLSWPVNQDPTPKQRRAALDAVLRQMGYFGTTLTRILRGASWDQKAG